MQSIPHKTLNYSFTMQIHQLNSKLFSCKIRSDPEPLFSSSDHRIPGVPGAVRPGRPTPRAGGVPAAAPAPPLPARARTWRPCPRRRRPGPARGRSTEKRARTRTRRKRRQVGRDAGPCGAGGSPGGPRGAAEGTGGWWVLGAGSGGAVVRCARPPGTRLPRLSPV